MTTENLFAPATRRIRPSRTATREQSALLRLTAAAAQCVDDLMRALERLPGRPYFDELVAVAASLHHRNIEGAVQGWRAIPWTYENERGYGGLAVCEARDARVKAAALALETAMARLKVCFRYGHIPEPASQTRAAPGPVLF